MIFNVEHVLLLEKPSTGHCLHIGHDISLYSYSSLSSVSTKSAYDLKQSS